MDASAFPCATRVLATDGLPEVTMRTTYLQANAEGVTVWAWSAAAQDAYPAVEGATVTGAHPQWEVHDAEGKLLAVVVFTANDCACGHPMKGWRPPGASRVSAEPAVQWGGPETSGYPPTA